jgi:hypothetical protein
LKIGLNFSDQEMKSKLILKAQAQQKIIADFLLKRSVLKQT